MERSDETISCQTYLNGARRGRSLPATAAPAQDQLGAAPERAGRGVERVEIGPELFEACRMGLEGLVSKHRERGYRGGRCDHWVKVKNRRHSAFERVQNHF